MSLKNFLSRTLKRGTTESDQQRSGADSSSPWEWLIDGAKPAERPATQGLARFIDVPRFGTGGDDHDLLPRARIEREVQRQAELKAADLRKRADAVMTKNSDLVDRFLEIAERKVSILDDYGDENWEALPEEIHKCLVKIAKRDPSIDVSKISPKSPLPANIKKLLGGYDEPIARHMAASLVAGFRAYHEARKKVPSAVQDITVLGGTDFETYLAKLLREAGFESVVGTPASGDQGADLIARRNGRVIAIQAKGYRGTVGNAAVQEIAGALRFYGADEGWVITNSAFTASARALARANNIRLVDGNELKDIAALRTKF
jgi:hypothetical protein